MLTGGANYGKKSPQGKSRLGEPEHILAESEEAEEAEWGRESKATTILRGIFNCRTKDMHHFRATINILRAND